MKHLIEEVRESDSVYMPVPARIASIMPLTDHETLFTIELPHDITLRHNPGQFVQVSLFGLGEAPISISSSPSRSNGIFELCVRRTGDLTNALHKLNPGAIIGVRGPFGKGFPIQQFRGKDILLLAGGLGMAPLRSLINEVLDERGNYGRVIILYGTRTVDDILFRYEMIEWAGRDDVELHLTVDKPDSTWTRTVGVITNLFSKVEIVPRNTAAVIVGPPVMYRFVLPQLIEVGIPKGNIWMSFERRMKCGVGKCGHCQLQHIYTCQEGPSFSYDEVEDLDEALS